MRRARTLILFLVVFLVSLQAIGAGNVKMKWVRSIYVDAKGSGLRYPEGVACTDDSVVVADTGNGRILRYTYEDAAVTPDAEFVLPKSVPIIVQLNSKGDIFVLDGRERRIMELSAAGEEMGFLRPQGLPSSRELVPKSFRIDGDDNIYILDIFSGQVVVLDADLRYSRHIPVPEERGFFTDLAVDRNGVVFLLDSVEAAVFVATREEKAFSPLTTSMKEYMNFPARLSVDDYGVLYLVDQNGSGLGIVGSDGSFLGRKFGLGWNESDLYYPSQMCIAANGTAFIADRNNSRVQMFSIGAN